MCKKGEDVAATFKYLMTQKSGFVTILIATFSGASFQFPSYPQKLKTLLCQHSRWRHPHIYLSKTTRVCRRKGMNHEKGGRTREYFNIYSKQFYYKHICLTMSHSGKDLYFPKSSYISKLEWNLC